ncbi:hypothetical protein M9H77_12204 [Catharanthus roseus]|uniref:Uncharacterized protein n=1 Tax=Catharanthus roseus TaxID=4058 RepID=A0ACC0BGP4_CATRO|nr:hypothetical protein M9H77_12204 [Catharanthus roseus]
MVKTKNANVGHDEAGGSSRGGKKGKRKQVARSKTPLDKFISVQVAANYEAWTQKKRKIAPGYRVDLSDMGGMEIIPALFYDVGWGSLLIVNEPFYPMMLYEFYANLQRGRNQSGGNAITSRVNGKKILSKMNFGYIAIEHMLATQSSSTKCLLYGYFITKIFQHFEINLVRVGDHIGLGDNSDEEEGNEPESMDDEEEDIRREMRSKKWQERTEEGQSSVDTALMLDRIAAMQVQLNDLLDDLNDKIVNIHTGLRDWSKEEEKLMKIKMIEDSF